MVIDGAFEKPHPDNRFGGALPKNPWFGTSLYAPPAEIITITKPSSLRGEKILCRIGASNCGLRESQKPWKRVRKNFTIKVLNDDTTRIYDLNGGNIYFILEEPLSKPETFIVSGGIKSPDFILGKTNSNKWKN